MKLNCEKKKLCFEDERRSYRFAWGWITNDRISFLGALSLQSQTFWMMSPTTVLIEPIFSLYFYSCSIFECSCIYCWLLLCVVLKSQVRSDLSSRQIQLADEQAAQGHNRSCKSNNTVLEYLIRVCMDLDWSLNSGLFYFVHFASLREGVIACVGFQLQNNTDTKHFTDYYLFLFYKTASWKSQHQEKHRGLKRALSACDPLV